MFDNLKGLSGSRGAVYTDRAEELRKYCTHLKTSQLAKYLALLSFFLSKP